MKTLLSAVALVAGACGLAFVAPVGAQVRYMEHFEHPQPSREPPSRVQPAREQPSRVQPSRVQPSREQAPRAQPPRAQSHTADKPPRRSYAAPRSRSAQGPQSNASSQATASSKGGVGVGSQGQSLVVDNHSRGPASSAIAPPLTSSNDTCMGSTSIGASGMAFGVSVGSTYVDENCMMLKNSRELWNMGYREAAIARMCMDSRNRQALETSGMRCPAEKKQHARFEPPPSMEVTTNDPAFR